MTTGHQLPVKKGEILTLKPLLLLAAISAFHGFAQAAPPECKEPGAPSGCFNLVPIEICDKAPVYEPEIGRVTYGCGFKIAPKNPKKYMSLLKAASKGAQVPDVVKKATVQVRYVGSTIKDNGDGTSTINHGGSATETINTADKAKTIKEYKERGVDIHAR
ncbi:MAG: hypothetical protein Q7T13_10965 [Polaromonas sp.]|nr:hypothetical protein [Polaromonas sp.]